MAGPRWLRDLQNDVTGVDIEKAALEVWDANRRGYPGYRPLRRLFALLDRGGVRNRVEVRSSRKRADIRPRRR